MAEIFRAKSRADGRWVALKMMRPSLGHEDLREQLFKREARIAAAIDHPNVVRLIEFGEEAERYFLAMEYIRGRDLTSLLGADESAREGLSFELALFIGLETARGLGFAHRLRDERDAPLQIVHRDISPGNVMVGYDGSVKVLDFGVARMNENEGVRTQTGTLRGKFAYMSPEQTLGFGVDARSDVFALGTLLYEMLTGANPFRARTPLKTIERVQRVRPSPPSRVDRRVPKEVDELLARCLAKDPARRFDDAQSFHDALADFLSRQAFGNAQERLSGLVAERFSWEKSEEERELKEEEEEVALIEVVDFSLGLDVGLDANRVVVSEEQEASQQEIRSHALDQPAPDDEGVFDARETARVAVPSAPIGAESSATTPVASEDDTGPRIEREADSAAYRGVAPSVPPPPPPPPDLAADDLEIRRYVEEGRAEPPAASDPGSSGPVALDLASTAAALPPNEVGKALASAALLGHAGVGSPKDHPTRAMPQNTAVEPGNTRVADPMLLAIAASGNRATSVPLSAEPESKLTLGKLVLSVVALTALAAAGYLAVDRARFEDPGARRPSPPRVNSVPVSNAEDAASPLAATEPPDATTRGPAGSSDAGAPPRPPDAGPPDAGPLAAPPPQKPDEERRAIERRRRPPPRKPATGAINVAATPWASIEIDGKPWPYQTPQAGIELSAGRHSIKLSNPDTGVSKTIPVVIKSGQTRTLSADLTKP